MKIVPVKLNKESLAYDITIENGALSAAGEWAASVLGGKPGKITVISNKKVFALYGDLVKQRLEKAGFKTAVFLIGDGERFKNLKTLEKALFFLGENKLARTDAVLALGGGVVGDLGGFAASVYLRGIAFLQMPTTLLSMIDSSVGGKTGVNTEFGKNLIGSFYQPKGVLIDPEVLRTLPQREITAGFCEAVKQGAISGPKLLKKTSQLLDNFGNGGFAKQPEHARFAVDLENLLAEQVKFKASIVRGDERESTTKSDAKSRKILNFGHTLAHSLEKITEYRYLKHGEAVGYGIIFAAGLSKKLGLLPADEVNLLNDVVHRAGKLPPIGHIDPAKVLETFKFDKKLIGNSLQWVLLKGIGKPVIVSQKDIPHSALLTTLRRVIRK